MSLAYEIVDTTKRLLKARGITYAQLAPKLGRSEAAVKRMFASGSITIARLEQICDVLGIGLAELAEHARASRTPLTELTLEQEEELIRDPALFLALYLALNNWREAEVLEHYTFTRPQWTALLARLDRMRVLDLLAGNRVRLRTARNFRWRADGPIRRFFEQKLLPQFFARPFTGPHQHLGLLTGMLSPAALAALERRIRDLAREFDLLLAQDAALGAEERIGVSVVLAMRPWELALFDRWRRPAKAP